MHQRPLFRHFVICLTVTTFLATASTTEAGIITPAGLQDGNQFRLVFVSSTFHDPLSADINHYDAIIQNLANGAGLGTYNGNAVSWQVIGSTPTVNARDPGRLPITEFVPIYRMDGRRISTGANHLWTNPGPSLPVEFTETGAHTIGEFGTLSFAFTGTNALGFAELPLGGEPNVMRGLAGAGGSSWMQNAPNFNGFRFHLYGISEVLTVGEVATVPEPASIVLLSLVTLGGIGLRIRRKREASVTGVA